MSDEEASDTDGEPEPASGSEDERADERDAGGGDETASWMRETADDGSDMTLEEVAGQEPKPEGEPTLGFLPTVPNAVVSLGAGCLLAATFVSLGVFGFVMWMRTTGNVRDLLPYEVTLAAIMMASSTALLAFGTYSARRRVRWTITMLSALVGSFAVLTIPFTVVAVVCIGLGRSHFTQPFVGNITPDADGADD